MTIFFLHFQFFCYFTMFSKFVLVELALVLCIVPRSMYCAGKLVVKTDSSETFTEGVKATLTCTFSPAQAEVDISWYRTAEIGFESIIERDVVEEEYRERFSLEYKGTSQRGGNGNLLIDPVRREDKRKYSCRIYNKEDGTEDGNVDLDVQWLSAPTVSLTPEDKNRNGFSRGENATLTCNHDGNPMPDIIWYKNNETIENDIDRYMLHNNRTLLTITNITLEDHDVFNCSTTNVVGTKFSNGVNLNVKHKPIVNVVYEGVDKIRCNASAYPLPYTYTFAVDGEPQSGEDDILTLNDEYSGACVNVSCQATNIEGGGWDEEEICLIGKPTPEPVEKLKGGVIAGIVIGCIVGLCLILLALLFAWKKSKSPSAPKSSATKKLVLFQSLLFLLEDLLAFPQLVCSFDKNINRTSKRR
ncbi:hemicentin-1-like [Anneissia japonica]|uniref:hemicentin-1-like n=1 Tax=Anneissia japonica TaxID=1529436 RepID=UPI001425B228|nr:hemicentin-1-like [Anneissia japonica]